MKKLTTIVETFQCDHCGTEFYTEWLCKEHERHCTKGKNNPYSYSKGDIVLLNSMQIGRVKSSITDISLGRMWVQCLSSDGEWGTVEPWATTCVGLKLDKPIFTKAMRTAKRKLGELGKLTERHVTMSIKCVLDQNTGVPVLVTSFSGNIPSSPLWGGGEKKEEQK